MTLEILPPLEDRLQRVARKLHLEESGYEKLLIAVLDKVLLGEDNRPVDEAALLTAATQGFPPEWWNRYRRLVTKRESGTITPEDLQVLIQMTEAAEERHAARLEAITALASMRGEEPRQLMSEMGLLPEPLTAA
jgi:hypothetical protein